jgi:hypothetical protein
MTKRLNRPKEIEQYFPVYGFYRYTEEEIPRYDLQDKKVQDSKLCV